ncbi:hypothetical protein FQZ97_576070 [compost metagenome]
MRRQGCCRLGQRLRLSAAACFLLIETDVHLDPHRQRIAAERLVVGRDRLGLEHCCLERLGPRHPLGATRQALGNHVVLMHRAAEQCGADFRHRPAPRVLVARGHRRRGADAQHVLRAQALAYPPHQHRNVGTLAPTIGVQLVQYEELQSPHVSDDFLVEAILPGHQQFEHHEVGQDDVGLRRCNALALRVAFLAGVALESWLEMRINAAAFDELLQFLALGIRQRVHRIDHDRARARRAAGALGLKDAVDDWHEEAQRLPRAGAGGDDVVAPL